MKSPRTIKKLSKKRRNERKLGEITEDYYFKETVSTDSYTVSRVVVSRDGGDEGGRTLYSYLQPYIVDNLLELLDKKCNPTGR